MLRLCRRLAPSLGHRPFSEHLDLSFIDEPSVNSELVFLVSSGQFSAAERLRLKLASNGLVVEHHAKFADVALACLRNRQLTGATGFKLEEYMTWVDLISDRKHLDDVASPFDPLVEELTARALVKSYVPFVLSTGSAAVSKGYARHHLVDIARSLVLFAPPESSAITHLIRWEELAVGFEEHYGCSGVPVATWMRSSLVRMFVERGWADKAARLVLKNRDYVLRDDVYESVLKSLREGRLKTLVLDRREVDRNK